jgi:3-oxoadipate enol-lactonase
MPYAIARDGTRLHYRVHDCTKPWSSPSTLILQHGFARSSEFWRAMVPALSRHYRVVCPDLRGLGESGTDFDPAHSLSIPTYLDDLIAIVDHLGEERVHYGGESFGGMLGVHFAVEHHARLASLCLMSTPPAPVFGARETFPCFGHASWQDALREMGPGEWSRAANAATRFPLDTDPALVEWFAEQGARCSVDVLVAMSRVIEQVDLKPLLPLVRAPVLGLYPTLAKTVTEEQMSLLRQIPRLRLVTLPIRFHMVWAMRPHSCAMNLLAFLAQLDGFDCFD